MKGSNALKLPAFIVLIHRFAESIRKEKPALERRVLETGQPLELDELVLSMNEKVETIRFQFESWDGENDFDFEAELDRSGSRAAEFVTQFINKLSFSVKLEHAPQRPPLRHAPDYPGFLTVWFGEEKILEASTFFGDTREADLRDAESFNGLSGLAGELVEKTHRDRRSLDALGLAARPAFDHQLGVDRLASVASSGWSRRGGIWSKSKHAVRFWIAFLFFFGLHHLAVGEEEVINPFPRAVLGQQLLKQWDFDDSPENWRPANDLETGIEKTGLLTFRSTGGDPFLYSPPVNFEQQLILKFRMRTTSPGPGQVFWIGQDQPGGERGFSNGVQLSSRWKLARIRD